MGEPRRFVSAQSVEQIAGDWIERRESGNWSEADQNSLDAWLAESYNHRVAYLRLKSTWDRADRLVVLRRQEGDQVGTPRKLAPIALRVAAGVLLLIAGTTALRDVTALSGHVYTTGLGEHRLVTLADGSHVELNTNTTLREKMTREARTVIVEHGEAYFEVRHDPSRPFVVDLGEHSVTDIGTKFVVLRASDRLSVAVTEGKVELKTTESSRRSDPLLLSAGNVAVATSGRIAVSTRSLDALANELAWRTGMLVFNHTTLAEAVSQFNRYNSEKLVIADPRASSLLIGGNFRTSDVKLFARIAQDLLGVHVKDKPGEQVISR